MASLNPDLIQRLTLKALDASLEPHQVGAHIKALNEGILVAPLDSRYTQVGFNLVPVRG